MKNNGSIGLCKAVVIAGIGLACWQVEGAIYPGNGGDSFGGALGTGNLTLTDNGTTISGTFIRGGGPHTDSVVIYIDSIGGGLATTAGIDDQADDLRRVVSGVGGSGRSTINFALLPLPFEADYAIALHNNNFDFGGLWQTINCSGNNCLPFVASVNLSAGGTTEPAYTFDFDLSEVGLTPGGSFKFVASYTSESGFRSNEAIGPSDAPPPAGINNNNVGVGTLTFSGFETYTTVPEPSSYVLLGLGALGLIFHLRRRRV